ncbi:kinesin-like protein KIF18A [Mytilus trossulus]|uniref:kinesin-like protein KIF18A n=1 Tax=Mytilus trossulus TaxID=6551 RepID=UPI003006F2AF
MTLAMRQRRPSYAAVATPRKDQRDDTENKSNVKVVVRIRPENDMEQSGNHRIVVRAMNEHVLVFDPNEQNSPEYGYRHRHHRRDIRKRQNKDLKFAFDYVFDPGSANHEVYQQTTKKILDSFMEGYNCSVFAYGATGAGKTHTMLGNPTMPGVMYLTMMDLYNRIGAVEGQKTCDIAVSYLEVYNEQIRDLLMGGKTLPVREDAKNGVVIPGLSLHKPKDADELLHMLHFGNKNRTQHPTDANAESSRSHAVFQVFVRQKDRTANISAEVKVAKLCLVDLAGSERGSVTKNRGKRFREGANINRSLLALGNVINALADPKYKGHVPYRDSKLTRLLKDSLGGNCQTVMIAAVSPSGHTYEDTYNTLKYADRAKNIQSTLKKNVLNVDFHVGRYGEIVEELRKEITELKEKLRFYEEGKLVAAVTMTSSVEICRLKEKLDDVFCTRLQFCREFLDAELKSRDLEWKIHRKEKCLSRMALISDNTSGLADKLKKMVSSSRSRYDNFHGNRDKCMKSLLENRKTVAEMEESVKSQHNCSGDNLETQNLKLTLQLHQKSIALTENQYCVKYLTKVVKSQEREIQSTERMITSLLHLVKQQHLIIKGSGMLTSDLEGEYQQIQSMAEGREVSFADQTFTAGNQSFCLSGLIDFKSFPSECIMGSETGTASESLLCNKETGHIISLKHSTETESEGNSYSYKSTATAGDTPFPNKSLPSRETTVICNQTNEANTVPVIPERLVPCTKSAEITCSSTTWSVLTVDSSVNKQNLTFNNDMLQNAFRLENKSCSLVKNSDVSYTSQSLDSTFTLEENKSDEQNSTFTLMDTSDKDPEIIARTPVIADKFSRSFNYDQSNSCVPNVNTKLFVNNTSSNVLSSLCQNTDSAINMKPHVAALSGCDSTVSVNNQCCLLSTLQSPLSVNASHSNSSVTAIQSQSNGMIELQSQYQLVSDSFALHSQNNLTGNTCVVQSPNNVNDKLHLSNIDVLQERCSLQNSSPNHQSSLINVVRKTPDEPVFLSRTNQLSNDNLTSQTINTDTLESAGYVTSQTATMETPDFQTGGFSSDSKSHAVRSITFGGLPCTPDSVRKARSYSEVVQSPQVVRTPLKEMNNNTPLSEQNLRQSVGSKMMTKKENLFGDNSEEIKKTCKKLNEFGLPSLMERWHTDPRKPRNQQTQQPSYMQPTKAARYRTKIRHLNNENLEPSRVPIAGNQCIKNRNFKRSQSVSNVKPGWQI